MVSHMEPPYILVISHFNRSSKCFEKFTFYELKLKVTSFSKEPAIGTMEVITFAQSACVAIE